MPPRLIIEIVGDTSGLDKSFEKAERSTRRFGRTIESAGRGSVTAAVGFKGLGRAVGYASASFLGAAGFVAAVKAGFGEMIEGQAIAADTAAVLKSTGQVAGVTAKQVDVLATSLQRLTGYDDEAIASAENLILTFTNVRNAAGKNNDIFTQTVKSTLDLSRRFGQDLSTSAVQLGKALQDPVRGITALGRAGISFTADQQRVITRLVRTGHLLDAQKILLREVRVETGGAAAAYGQTMAGQIDILKGNLTNLAGELATVLNPEVKRLTERFNEWLENPENKQAIIDGFTGSVNALGSAFKFAADTAGFLKDVWDTIPDSLPGKNQGLLDLIKPGGGGAGFLPDLSGFGGGGDFPTGERNPSATRTGAAPPGTVPPPAAPRGVTATQRNAWFDAMINRQLGRVQDVTSLQGQIGRLETIAKLIRGRLTLTKDVTRRITLTDRLADVLRDQRRTRASLADEFKARAEDAAAAADEAKRLAAETKRLIAETASADIEAVSQNLNLGDNRTDFSLADVRKAFFAAEKVRQDAEQRAQFRSLGLTGAGEQFAPAATALRAQANKLRDAIKGTVLDTEPNRNILANIRKTINEHFHGLTRDTKLRMQEFLDAIADPLKDADKKTGFKHLSPNKLARMLGFTGRDEIRQAAAVLAQVGYGGTIPKQSGQFAAGHAGGTVYIVNNPSFHGVDDIGKFEAALAKRAQARPQVRRGAR